MTNALTSVVGQAPGLRRALSLPLRFAATLIGGSAHKQSPGGPACPGKEDR